MSTGQKKMYARWTLKNQNHTEKNPLPCERESPLKRGKFQFEKIKNRRKSEKGFKYI